MVVTAYPGRLKGAWSAPPSKSYLHRALLCASLAKGESAVAPACESEDVNATLRALGTLGARVRREGDTFFVEGGGRVPEAASADCAESGSTLRFLLPIRLALGADTTWRGRGRLGERPLWPYEWLFRERGILWRMESTSPLSLRTAGRLGGGRFELPGNVSSQFVTGLLLALPLTGEASEIALSPPVESRGYIDMTLETMRAFGAEASWTDEVTLAVPAESRYAPVRYAVEGDFSQAAVFLCADALGAEVTLCGLPERTCQRDAQMIGLLERMGAVCARDSGGLRLRAGRLKAADIDASQCPDAVPMLALAASLAEGRSRIRGAARLRLKECDRLRAVREELNRLGANVTETCDGLDVEGVSRLTGGVRADCHGDHRIAMMLAVAALRAEREVALQGAECVAKSYPRFFEELRALGGVTSGKRLG